MRNNLRKIEYVVGVDEAGRGPLAGPVAVGAVRVPRGFRWSLIPGVGDSKQVSRKKRETIYRHAIRLRRKGVLDFRVALVGVSVIDGRGISAAVQEGVEKSFRGLGLLPGETRVLLDGLLSAPPEFIYQRTIIRGDAKEKVIGLASILAKVTRDRHMARLARRYPLYGFEIHMGYGTLAHRMRIKRHKLSPVHRKTFCRNVLSAMHSKK